MYLETYALPETRSQLHNMIKIMRTLNC